MTSKNMLDQFVQMPPAASAPAPAQPPISQKPNMPQQIASQFSNYVKAGIQLLVWSVVAVASLAAGYVAVRGIWAAVKMILVALGVEGGS